MRITTLAVLATLCSSPSFATIIEFSGTVDYHSNIEIFPEDFFPNTFTGYLAYDAAAATDKAAVQTIGLFIGDSSFIRTTRETQSQALTSIGPHSLTYTDPSGAGTYLAGHPFAYLNTFDLAFYWPDAGPEFGRDSVDFPQVIGGNFHLALADLAHADQLQGLGVWGTITSVTAVPEPATLGLFGVGLVGIAAFRRRPARRS